MTFRDIVIALVCKKGASPEQAERVFEKVTKHEEPLSTRELTECEVSYFTQLGETVLSLPLKEQESLAAEIGKRQRRRNARN